MEALIRVEPSGCTNEASRVSDVPVLLVYDDYLSVSSDLPLLFEIGQSWLETFYKTGGQVDVIDLPHLGVHGSIHMLMMDDDSDDVLGRVTSWLDDELCF